MEEQLPFIIFGAVFALIGFAILCANLVGRLRARKKCSTQVVAKCVRISNASEAMVKEGEDVEEGDTLLEAPVFEISYNGQTFELDPHTYTNVCKTQVGEIRNIYINPDDPKEYYDPKEDNMSMGWLEIISAIGMVIFGLLFIFVPIIVESEQ